MIIRQKRKFPALILFLLGFLAGNLIPNLIWKMKWRQKTWTSIYFLSTFAGKNISGTEYLTEILKYRGCYYLLNVICGFSVFGAPLAVLTLLLSGLYTGMIMAASILWICRWSDRNGPVNPAISGLYPCLSIFYGTGMGNVSRNLEKPRDTFSESRHIYRQNVYCSGWISVGHSCRMLCESVGYQQNIGIYKNFLKYTFTIFSIGCHKIFDI